MPVAVRVVEPMRVQDLIEELRRLDPLCDVRVKDSAIIQVRRLPNKAFEANYAVELVTE